MRNLPVDDEEHRKQDQATQQTRYATPHIELTGDHARAAAMLRKIYQRALELGRQKEQATKEESAAYTCPVCDYDKLKRPPEGDTICPSCGTQFGYHDFTLSHAELRERWIKSGRVWHSKRITAPEEPASER